MKTFFLSMAGAFVAMILFVIVGFMMLFGLILTAASSKPPSPDQVVLSLDLNYGLPDQAPFDRIIVTAAAEDPPGPLMEQLKVGGIMVLPVGQSDDIQQLIRIEKTENGPIYSELSPVRFVPLLEGLAADVD